jgi:putative amino-acid transport system ATP-binding protein
VDAEHHTKRDVLELRKHTSMVFQGYNLFKNKTALENVMEAMTVVQKKSKDEARKTALELLDKVGMSERRFLPFQIIRGAAAAGRDRESSGGESECSIV